MPAVNKEAPAPSHPELALTSASHTVSAGVRIIAGASGFGAALLLMSNLAAERIPGELFLICIGVVGAAAFRLEATTLAVVAALPVAGVLGLRAGMRTPGAEPLTIALVCGWLISLAVTGRKRTWPAGARWSLIALTAIIAASIAAELLVQPLLLGGYDPPIWPILSREFFIAPQWFPALQAGVVMLESIALAAIAYETTEDPARWDRLAAMLVAGGAIAAVLNIVHFVELVGNSDWSWRDVPKVVLSARVNVLHGDINAAGSMFALMLFAAAGFVAARRHMRPAASSLAILCCGLWLTGSRAALLTVAALAVMVAGAWSLRSSARWQRPVAATLAATLAIVFYVAQTAYPARFGSGSANVALEIRRHMALAAIKMAADRPVFGVGVGRFYDRSTAYMSPWVLRHYPRENAHNNFLQMLAELGITGLAAFGAVAVAALRGAPSAQNGRPHSGLRMGVVAFLVTCLSGHPLLVRDVSYVFFIALGLLISGAARTEAGVAAVGRGRWKAAAIAAGIVILVASLPIRARASVKLLDLENVARGMWSPTLTGPRPRSVGRHAVFFVRADRPRIELPLRAKERFRNPAIIEVWLDGRVAGRFSLPVDGWMPYRLVLAGRPDQPGFHRVDLFVTAPEWTGGNPALDAGVEMEWPRPPSS